MRQGNTMYLGGQTSKSTLKHTDQASHYGAIQFLQVSHDDNVLYHCPDSFKFEKKLD
jgi:hypothetical protein